MALPNTCGPGGTKGRILDAAEDLFARNGYKRTSIKALAQQARVNQAAVNYHFGSKRALVENVIERRLSPINRMRMDRFDAIEEAFAHSGRAPAVEELLRAFVEPVFAVTDPVEKGRCFLMIEGRAFAEADDAIRRIFIRHFRPAFMRLSDLMAAALPELPRAVLNWRLHFVIGALAHTLRVCGAPPPAPDFFPPSDPADSVVALLVAFLVHGMKAPESGPAPTHHVLTAG